METGNYSNNTHTTAGTAGGTLLVILLQIHSADIARTAVLACTGAIVSFAVSLLLRFVVKWAKKH